MSAQEQLVELLDQIPTGDDRVLADALASRSPEKLIELMGEDDEFASKLEVARVEFGATGCHKRQRRKTLYAAMLELERRRELASRVVA